MDEFRMSAFARYDGGRSGDAFAEVSGVSLVACFVEMAAEVTEWLPGALSRAVECRSPRAIELTLEWDGAAAREYAPGPSGASGDADRGARRPRRRVLCVAHRRPGGAPRTRIPAPAAIRGEPV